MPVSDKFYTDKMWQFVEFCPLCDLQQLFKEKVPNSNLFTDPFGHELSNRQEHPTSSKSGLIVMPQPTLYQQSKTLFQPGEAQRERARLGGIKSGEARRRKRDIERAKRAGQERAERLSTVYNAQKP